MMTEPVTTKRDKGRVPVPVGRNLEQRLLAYAAAASASLVGAQPAAAKVIYTPINLSIAQGTALLDLNHDGITDFNLVDNFFIITGLPWDGWGSLKINGAGHPGAGVVGNPLSGASALEPNADIGPARNFLSIQRYGARMAYAKQIYLSYDQLFCSGAFDRFCRDTTDRFLGLRFVVSGKTYYGWAGFSAVKLSVNFFGKPYIQARLTGVAYEDEPGQAIRAGQMQDGTAMIEAAPNPPRATLGLLALGAPGLDIWRKPEQGSE